MEMTNLQTRGLNFLIINPIEAPEEVIDQVREREPQRISPLSATIFISSNVRSLMVRCMAERYCSFKMGPFLKVFVKRDRQGREQSHFSTVSNMKEGSRILFLMDKGN